MCACAVLCFSFHHRSADLQDCCDCDGGDDDDDDDENDGEDEDDYDDDDDEGKVMSTYGLAEF